MRYAAEAVRERELPLDPSGWTGKQEPVTCLVPPLPSLKERENT